MLYEFFDSAIQFYSTSMFQMAGMENPSLGTVGVGGKLSYKLNADRLNLHLKYILSDQNRFHYYRHLRNETMGTKKFHVSLPFWNGR